MSSFRTPDEILTSGWWSIVPHRAWVETDELPLPEDVDREQLIEIEGIEATFDQWRDGIETDDGKRITWAGTLRVGNIEIEERRWTANANFTLNNYTDVAIGYVLELDATGDGNEEVFRDEPLYQSFLNSFIVTIPATIIPIFIAAMAAYAIAWMRFSLRYVVFIGIILLLVVPLQTALVPLLRDFNFLGINGTFLSVWIAHTGFGLPLATYLLYNYISQLPRETLESAFVDGASHFKVFTKIVLPLSIPAVVSFSIFQFLWVWNDFLVASIFISTTEGSDVLTQRLIDLQGARGEDWHLLTAAAFVSIIVPLIVFLSLQRYFIRGILSGSVKG